jgi:hypothetical protein
MIGTPRIFSYLFVFLAFWSGHVSGGQSVSQGPCPVVGTMLVTQFISNMATDHLPRVEVRRCGSEEALQIVAWKENAELPSLIVNTTDFTIVQAVARENVFLIETTGGPRDIVWVIVYEKGDPKLALKRVTKGTAIVKTNDAQMDVVISGIWKGDGKSQSESHSFRLSLDDLFSRFQR